MVTAGPVRLDDITAAAERVAPYVYRTPVFGSRTLDELTGLRLSLKAETFQRTGSFKPRGILNKVMTLTPSERERGLVSVSAGNAAAAVAFGASIVGARATICMPATAVPAKIAATQAYGGEVELVEGNLLEAFHARSAGRTVVHPFDDPAVVDGHGSLGLEIAEQVPETDVVIVPVGGGGLISGVAAALAYAAPRVRVVGVEPEASKIVADSLAADKVLSASGLRTIADGLNAPTTGELMLDCIRAYVSQLVTVTERQIADAMRLLMERTKLVVEPAAAASLAALLAGDVDVQAGSRVCLLLSGGNLDLRPLAS